MMVGGTDGGIVGVSGRSSISVYISITFTVVL